jgi:hypothetical protein
MPQPAFLFQSVRNAAVIVLVEWASALLMQSDKALEEFIAGKQPPIDLRLLDRIS